MARAVEGSTPGEGTTPGSLIDPAEVREARERGLRIPDFFIVGHQKCGTTALYKMIQNHPEIYLPEMKEPRFFITERLTRPSRENGRGRPVTLAEYLELFAEAGPRQMAGEASPQYLQYAEAPAAIATLNPDAKIIALLREPADFLRSYHGQQLHNRVEEEKDFQRAMELEPARRRGERFPPGCDRRAYLIYSDQVRYAEQLSHVFASFPREQVLVLIYEEYRRENEPVVRQVLRFLGVDDALPLAQVDTPPLKDVRLAGLHRLTTSMQEGRRNPAAVGRGVRMLDAAIPGPVRSALGSSWRRVIYRPRATPDDEFVAGLRRRFKPEVEAVSELLGRDLVALWGYSRID